MARQHHASKMHEELAIIRKYYPNRKNNEIHRIRKQILDHYGSVEEWERKAEPKRNEPITDSYRMEAHTDRMNGGAAERIDEAVSVDTHDEKHLASIGNFTRAGQLVIAAGSREKAHAYIDAYCDLTGDESADHDPDKEEG